jgi:hypothetical protein
MFEGRTARQAALPQERTSPPISSCASASSSRLPAGLHGQLSLRPIHDGPVIQTCVIAEMTRDEIHNRRAHADHAVRDDGLAGHHVCRGQLRLQLLAWQEASVGGDERVPWQLCRTVDVPGGVHAHPTVRAEVLSVRPHVHQ